MGADARSSFGCVGDHAEADHLRLVRLWRVPCVRCGDTPAGGGSVAEHCAACLLPGWVALRVRGGARLTARRNIGARVVGSCPECLTWADRLRLRLGLAKPLESL